MLLFTLEEKIMNKLYKTITQVDKEVLIQQCLAFSLRLLELSFIYRTRAIITRGLYTFYPLFEVHLCTVTFGLMYG